MRGNHRTAECPQTPFKRATCELPLRVCAGKCRIRAINRGERVYVRVDAFNENGITHGQAVCLR